ncbi:MAG: protease modulator HflC [Verrucomicrobia bacterium]|nr:protease modulator HflC [Verrucomicrobiota bacterium]
MKRNYLTLFTGAVLVVIFALMLFVFQVRQTEVAVVTTFGKYSHSITNAGASFRWPLPIQKVYKFDNRVQNFESKYDQITTKDARNILISVFVGWRIAEPKTFLERFGGGDIMSSADQSLDALVRNTKNSVVGQHTFNDLISTNRSQLKFDEIERQMLTMLRPQALANYGIGVQFLGIQRLGLPESITSKVFDRMKAERNRLVKEFQSQGDARAQEIRSEAERQRRQILAEAERKAIEIQGQADLEATRYYAVFAQNPELANFLLSLRTLEAATTNRTTLVLDQQTPPFNLLNPKLLELTNSTEKTELTRQ